MSTTTTEEINPDNAPTTAPIGATPDNAPTMSVTPDTSVTGVDPIEEQRALALQRNGGITVTPPGTVPAVTPQDPSVVSATAPTSAVSIAPTTAPSLAFVAAVSVAPTTATSAAPTTAVSVAPTTAVSVAPSTAPSTAVSVAPSTAPSTAVSTAPTTAVSTAPSTALSTAPSVAATTAPSTAPTPAPTLSPEQVQRMQELEQREQQLQAIETRIREFRERIRDWPIIGRIFDEALRRLEEQLAAQREAVLEQRLAVAMGAQQAREVVEALRQQAQEDARTRFDNPTSAHTSQNAVQRLLASNTNLSPEARAALGRPEIQNALQAHHAINMERHTTRLNNLWNEYAAAAEEMGRQDAHSQVWGERSPTHRSPAEMAQFRESFRERMGADFAVVTGGCNGQRQVENAYARAFEERYTEQRQEYIRQHAGPELAIMREAGANVPLGQLPTRQQIGQDLERANASLRNNPNIRPPVTEDELRRFQGQLVKEYRESFDRSQFQQYVENGMWLRGAPAPRSFDELVAGPELRRMEELARRYRLREEPVPEDVQKELEACMQAIMERDAREGPPSLLDPDYMKALGERLCKRFTSAYEDSQKKLQAEEDSKKSFWEKLGSFIGSIATGLCQCLGLDKIWKGICMIGKGIITGNLSEIGKGFVEIAKGVGTAVWELSGAADLVKAVGCLIKGDFAGFAMHLVMGVVSVASTVMMVGPAFGALRAGLQCMRMAGAQAARQTLGSTCMACAKAICITAPKACLNAAKNVCMTCLKGLQHVATHLPSILAKAPAALGHVALAIVTMPLTMIKDFCKICYNCARTCIDVCRCGFSPAKCQKLWNARAALNANAKAATGLGHGCTRELTEFCDKHAVQLQAAAERAGTQGAQIGVNRCNAMGGRLNPQQAEKIFERSCMEATEANMKKVLKEIGLEDQVYKTVSTSLNRLKGASKEGLEQIQKELAEQGIKVEVQALKKMQTALKNGKHLDDIARNLTESITDDLTKHLVQKYKPNFKAAFEKEMDHLAKAPGAMSPEMQKVWAENRQQIIAAAERGFEKGVRAAVHACVKAGVKRAVDEHRQNRSRGGGEEDDFQYDTGAYKGEVFDVKLQATKIVERTIDEGDRDEGPDRHDDREEEETDESDNDSTPDAKHEKNKKDREQEELELVEAGPGKDRKKS